MSMEKARIQTIITNPFWGSLATRLILREDKSVPIAATDGKYIFYNPDRIEEFTLEEKKFILLHEVAHCALMHPFRKNGRNHKLWNTACDFAIHSLFKDLSNEKIIEGRFRYKKEFMNMSAEEIYKFLLDNAVLVDKGELISNDSGEGKIKVNSSAQTVYDDLKYPEESESKEVLEEQWKEAIASSKEHAKSIGFAPQFMERLFKDDTPPTVDWRKELRKYMTSKDRSDYSWAMPSRRYQNIYMPSMQNESLGGVSIIVDTSGSIDEESLSAFESEIKDIFQTCSPESLQIIYCDMDVKKSEEYYEGESWTFNPVGGGGTDLSPAMEAAKNNTVIVFSDMCFEYKKLPYQPNTLFVVTDDMFNADDLPFGESIILDRKNE